MSLFCRKAATHDSEIRHLYEEMEAQIKNEKDRLVLKVQVLKINRLQNVGEVSTAGHVTLFILFSRPGGPAGL